LRQNHIARVKTWAGPNNQKYEYHYDDKNRKIRLKTPDGKVVLREFDKSNQQIAEYYDGVKVDFNSDVAVASVSQTHKVDKIDIAKKKDSIKLDTLKAKNISKNLGKNQYLK